MFGFHSLSISRSFVWPCWSLRYRPKRSTRQSNWRWWKNLNWISYWRFHQYQSDSAASRSNWRGWQSLNWISHWRFLKCHSDSAASRSNWRGWKPPNWISKWRFHHCHSDCSTRRSNCCRTWKSSSISISWSKIHKRQTDSRKKRERRCHFRNRISQTEANDIDHQFERKRR